MSVVALNVSNGMLTFLLNFLYVYFYDSLMLSMRLFFTLKNGIWNKLLAYIDVPIMINLSLAWIFEIDAIKPLSEKL